MCLLQHEVDQCEAISREKSWTTEYVETLFMEMM